MRLDMRRSAALRFAAAAVVCLMVSGASRAAAISGGAWRRAIEVPGTAALNKGGYAQVNSVSCASAGNCSAGGYYTDSARRWQAFVVSEVHGTWGKAIEVPGTAALNIGGDPAAQVSSVSCASAGNCSAGGYYRAFPYSVQAFVVSETNGTWGKAIKVPGTATLNPVQVNSVSCASAGNCSAGGYYFDSAGSELAFVAGEVNGTWGKAIEVPGIATLNQGEDAQVTSVSCASAGNCSAGGTYNGYLAESVPRQQVFVVSETNGIWGTAIEVPGTATLDQGVFAQVFSVSCASPGNCSAGGFYTDSAALQQAFVVSETNGTWRKAREVPGLATLNKGWGAQVNSVSCASAGNCSAGGFYIDSANFQQAFVVSETNGTWGKAMPVPGTATLSVLGGAQVNSVSCASAGNCSAGGYDSDSAHRLHAFVVSEANGTWGKAIVVPGTATLRPVAIAAQVGSVSCASARNCSAAGTYIDSTGSQQLFVANKN